MNLYYNKNASENRQKIQQIEQIEQNNFRRSSIGSCRKWQLTQEIAHTHSHPHRLINTYLEPDKKL